MPPKVRTCRRCKKLFTDLGNPYCYDCLGFIDEQYVVAREYLYENQGAGFEKLIEDTNMERDVLNALIKQGRIAFKADGEQYLCTVCGKLNGNGRLCERCEKAAQAINKVAATIALKPEPKKTFGKTKQPRNVKMYTRGD